MCCFILRLWWGHVSSGQYSLIASVALLLSTIFLRLWHLSRRWFQVCNYLFSMARFSVTDHFVLWRFATIKSCTDRSARAVRLRECSLVRSSIVINVHRGCVAIWIKTTQPMASGLLICNTKNQADILVLRKLWLSPSWTLSCIRVAISLAPIELLLFRLSHSMR